MINDSKFKLQLRKILVFINVFLSAIIVVLFAMWLLLLKPMQIELATRMEQYAAFDINNLPDIVNKIDADYFGNNYADGTENQDNEAINEGSEGENIVQARSIEEQEEILDKAEEILKKSNQILSDKNQKQEIAEGELEVAKKDDVVESLVLEPRKNKKAKVALVITNLGLNKKSTELALSLPKHCALGFLPYTKSLKPLLHKAQTNGHEIYLYLPLQTSRSHENPGKYALLGNLPAEENIVRLNVVLNSHARYDGVYSSFKEIFTANAEVSEGMLDHLDGKNLIFIMGRTMDGKIPAHLQKRDNLVYTNVVIDKDPDEHAINNNLEKLIKAARQNGVALGYSQGYTLTIEMIKEWLPKLRDRGISLVPVSELLKKED